MVKAPPIMGPVARPSCPMPILSPMKSACFFVGRTAEIVVTAPLATPADPAPAITRPMMNMGDDWAAPQIAEPTSKIKKKTRKLHCVLSEFVFSVGLGNVMYLYRKLAVDFAA